MSENRVEEVCRNVYYNDCSRCKRRTKTKTKVCSMYKSVLEPMVLWKRGNPYAEFLVNTTFKSGRCELFKPKE